MKTKEPQFVLVLVGVDRFEGIGGAVAQAIHRQIPDAALVLQGRGKGVNELAAELRRRGHTAVSHQSDATDAAAVAAAADETLNRFGHIDALYLNAAHAPADDDDLLDLDPARLLDGFRGNVLPALLWLKAVVPPMLQRNFGRIVLMSSENAYAAGYGQACYGFAKFSLEFVMGAVVNAVRGHEIFVNTVSPSTTPNAGESWNQRRAAQPNVEQALAAINPRGRLHTDAEVAQSVIFRLSPYCFETGTVLHLDGGLRAVGVPWHGTCWQAQAAALYETIDLGHLPEGVTRASRLVNGSAHALRHQ